MKCARKSIMVMTYEHLRACPACGHNAIIRKNASKRFQVYCPHCHAKTDWTDKTNAVIMWYNNATIYERNTDKAGA